MSALEQIRRHLARHAELGDGSPALVDTPLPGVTISVSTRLMDAVCEMTAPTFALVAQGERWTRIGRSAHLYGPGTYLATASTMPFTGPVTKASPGEPFLALVMTLEPAAIATLLLEAAAERLPVRPASPLGISQAGPALLDACARMTGLLDAPGDAAVLAPAYEREIIWRLLNGEQAAIVRRIGLADSRLAHLGRAIGWIRAHYREPLRIERLAELSAMSVSSFHRHFRAVMQMTPLQYQRQLRLTEARALLATRPGDVAGVGFAVGYDSASQFSREYRRLFGVPPGRDGARIRALAQAG